MRVFLSAGEASGDTYAAALVAEMQRLSVRSPVEYEGVGGKRLAATGAKLIAESTHWGAISIVQALQVVPRVMRGYYRAKAALSSGAPGLFIPIDFGYANIRLARHAKNRGWKVLYFMPPGSWRRDKQGGDLPLIADEIVTPFSWSAELLTQMGARAHWFGHPIRQLIRDRGFTGAEARDRVAILPGSRAHEIERNLPAIAAALVLDSPFAEPVEFAIAPSVDVQAVRARWSDLTGGATEATFTQGDVYGVLNRSKAAIVCSGTATLEAALSRCPMVVIYVLTPGMVAEARLLRIKRPRFISLPNILLQRMAVPELVHYEAEPRRIRTELESLLGEARKAQMAAFDVIERLLGPDDALTRTAELALRMAGAHPSS